MYQIFMYIILFIYNFALGNRDVSLFLSMNSGHKRQALFPLCEEALEKYESLSYVNTVIIVIA